MSDMQCQYNHRKRVNNYIDRTGKSRRNNLKNRLMALVYKAEIDQVKNNKCQKNKPCIRHQRGAQCASPRTSVDFIRHRSCFKILNKKYDARGNVNDRESQQPQFEYNQNRTQRVELLSICIECGTTLIKRKVAGQVHTQKAEEAQAGNRHQQFFTDG